MGNASRQSKQKQQASKKGSQGSQAPKTNGEIAREGVRIQFSVRQADLIKGLLAASQEAQAQLQFALMAAGIDGRDIVGGDLDGPDPYLVVMDAGGIDGE